MAMLPEDFLHVSIMNIRRCCGAAYGYLIAKTADRKVPEYSGAAPQFMDIDAATCRLVRSRRRPEPGLQILYVPPPKQQVRRMAPEVSGQGT